MFPDNAPPRNMERIIKSENLVNKILDRFINTKIMWAVAKKDILKKNNIYCLKLDDSHSAHSIDIQFDKIQKKLETNKHIFFYADSIKLNCR